MKNGRLYYIDWLRCFVILTLIPYHAALTYTGLGEIYIKDPVVDMKVIPFIFTTMPLDSFFMTLLFFVSGISTYYSMISKKDFLKGRIKKLLIPFIFGTVLLCPIQAFTKAIYNGITDNFIDFLPIFFSSEIVEYLGYAHLWFLLYLIIITTITFPLLKRLIASTSIFSKISIWVLKGNNIYFPFLWIIVIEALLRPYFPGMQIFVFDWANDLVYLSIFLMGFIYASDSKIQSRVDEIFKPSLFVTIITFIGLFFIYYYWLVLKGDSFTITRVWAIIKGLYETSLIITLLYLGRKYLNKTNNMLNYLKKSSFFYYLFHLVVGSYLTLLIVDLNINVYLKYFITVSISYVILVLLFKVYSLLKVPLIRNK